MSATCYYCGWWTDINGVCVCGYSGKPTVRNDSCMAWKPKNEIVTNADRIRAMTDEELADALFYGQFTTKKATLDWLKQGATE